MVKATWIIKLGARIVFFLVLLGTARARADFFESFEMQGGLDIPSQAGIRARANFSGGAYASFGLGFVTSSFIETWINSFGVVGQRTATIVAQGLNTSLYLDARGGYVFGGGDSSEGGGFFIEGGFANFNRGNGNTDIQTIEEATGFLYPTVPQNVNILIESEATSLVVQGGYRYLIDDKWALNFGAGFLKPISSRHNVIIQRNFNLATDDIVTNDVRNFLDNIYTGDLWLFTLSATIGIRF